MNLDTYFMIKEAVRNKVRGIARAMPLPVEEPAAPAVPPAPGRIIRPRALARAMPLPYEESGASGPVPDRFRIGDMGSLGRLETQKWPYKGAAPAAPAPAPRTPGRIRRPRALARAMPLPDSALSPEEQKMLDIFRAGWNKNR